MKLANTNIYASIFEVEFLYYENLFSSKHLKKLEELFLIQDYLTLDDQVFKTLVKDNFPSLKYVELPRINKKLDLLIGYESTEYDRTPYSKIENLFWSEFGPRNLNIGNNYEDTLKSLQEYAVDSNHSVHNVESISIWSIGEHSVILSLFNTNIFKDLLSLEILGDNFVEDFEEFAQSDQFELINLETLFVNWKTKNENILSKWIINNNFSN